MVIYGTLSNIRAQKTKKGEDAVIVDITRKGKWNPDTRAFGPDETTSIWYFNGKKGQQADWALERKDMIGKPVILTAQKITNDNQDVYFGRYLPVSYGMVTDPAVLKETSDDVFAEAIMMVEACQDARELPEDVEVDFKNADSIASVIHVLNASDSTLAADAVAALSKLIYGESNAYIGKVGNVARYGQVTRVSFVTPRSNPVEWNSVSFFGKTAERVERVLKKGDNVVLIMHEKEDYNGQPSYRGINFQRL